MGQPEPASGGHAHGHGEKHGLVAIFLWVAAWYGVSSANSYSINRAFDDGMGVAQLLLLQYITGVVMGLLSRKVAPRTLASFNSEEFICGAMHASGSLATLASLKLLRPPFVQMSKALEPVFGVFFAFLLGFPLEPRRQFLISLLISCGLGLTVIAEAMASCWSVKPFLLALLSCVCFQLRNVFSKRYLETTKVPAATFYFVMCRDALYSSAAFFLVYQVFSPQPLASWTGQWALVEAVTYTLYNLISYFVLEMVSSPVTHAILGTLKRAVIIASLAVLYHIPMTTMFLAGSLLTLSGCYLHSIVAKRLPKPSFGSINATTRKSLFTLAAIVLLIILCTSVAIGNNRAKPQCSTAKEAPASSGSHVDTHSAGSIDNKDPGNTNSNSNNKAQSGQANDEGKSKADEDVLDDLPPGPSEPFTCATQTMPVFFWNGRVGMWKRGNFGDDFNIAIMTFMLNVTHTSVKRVDQKYILPVSPAAPATNSNHPKLLAVGSVLAFARTGDVLWGVGVHEKSLSKVDWEGVKRTTITALRGPLGCAALKKEGVLKCGEGVGDPALFAPVVWPWLRPSANPKHARCYIPHHFDEVFVPMATSLGYNVILSSQSPIKVAEAMMQCAHVVSSSLHGLIFADAFGIPATWLRNVSSPVAEEGVLKYRDHFASTGRVVTPTESLADPPTPIPRLAPEKLKRLLFGLIDSFPYDRVCQENIGAVARLSLKRKVKQRLNV
eukprot:m.10879 g.10879  ORF g.10879 m.10879 type:complete len:724 (+) comp5687_c0_seq1:165-2336(+)